MSRNSKQVFRPGSYNLSESSESESAESSSYETMNSASIINESIITTKGGKQKKKIQIKMAELNSLVVDLRNNSDQKINRITGDIKVKFGQLKHLVTLLYDTNSYNILVDKVNKHFKDLETIIPGTIGAYCIGCDRGNACSPICAGSMPMNNDDSQNCKDTVILAEYNNGKYDFTLLKARSDDSKKSMDSKNESSDSESEYRTNGFERKSKSENNSGYVFVPHTTLDDFDGFNIREKRMLEKFGIDHINLYGYNENGDDQFKLDSDHIDNIKSRSGRGKGRGRKSEQADGTNTFMFIFVIIFIIFLLVAGFLLANKWRYGKI